MALAAALVSASCGGGTGDPSATENSSLGEQAAMSTPDDDPTTNLAATAPDDTADPSATPSATRSAAPSAASDGEGDEPASSASSGSGTDATPLGRLEPLPPASERLATVLSVVTGTVVSAESLSNHVAWSPTQHRVAIATTAGVYVYSTADFDAAPQFFDAGAAEVHVVAFDPTGRYVAGGGIGLRVWDLNVGTEVAAWDLTPLTIAWPSPDRLVAVEGDRIMAANPIDGTVAWQAPSDSPQARSVAVALEADRIAHPEPDRLVVRSMSTGEVVFSTPAGPSFVALANDGTRVATLFDGNLVVWDTGSGEVIGERPIGYVDDLGFSDDRASVLWTGEGLQHDDVATMTAAPRTTSVRTEGLLSATWADDAIFLYQTVDYTPRLVTVDPDDDSDIRVLYDGFDLAGAALSPSNDLALVLTDTDVRLISIDGTALGTNETGPLPAAALGDGELTVGGGHAVIVGARPDGRAVWFDLDRRSTEVLAELNPRNASWSVDILHDEGIVALSDLTQSVDVSRSEITSHSERLAVPISDRRARGPIVEAVRAGRCIEVSEARSGEVVGAVRGESIDTFSVDPAGDVLVIEQPFEERVAAFPVAQLPPPLEASCDVGVPAWTRPTGGSRRTDGRLLGISIDGHAIVQEGYDAVSLDLLSGDEIDRVSLATPEPDARPQLGLTTAGWLTARHEYGTGLYDPTTGALLLEIPAHGNIDIDPTGRRLLIVSSGEAHVYDLEHLLGT